MLRLRGYWQRHRNSLTAKAALDFALDVGSEQVLLGGPDEGPGATVELSGGEAVAAPSGRADDFSWPRGVVNVELAAPDSAAPDAGAKSAMAAERKSAMDAYAAQTGREQKPRGRKSRR